MAPLPSMAALPLGLPGDEPLPPPEAEAGPAGGGAPWPAPEPGDPGRMAPPEPEVVPPGKVDGGGVEAGATPPPGAGVTRGEAPGVGVDPGVGAVVGRGVASGAGVEGGAVGAGVADGAGVEGGVGAGVATGVGTGVATGVGAGVGGAVGAGVGGGVPPGQGLGVVPGFGLPQAGVPPGLPVPVFEVSASGAGLATAVDGMTYPARASEAVGATTRYPAAAAAPGTYSTAAVTSAAETAADARRITSRRPGMIGIDESKMTSGPGPVGPGAVRRMRCAEDGDQWYGRPACAGPIECRGRP